MKKWLFVVLTLGAALLPATGRAQYEKGVHYLEVPFAGTAPAGGRVEVREFFWYGCPHCHDLEPTIAQWLKKIPPHVKFVRTPGTLAPQWLVHAQAFYAFESLGAAERLHGPFFNAIHERRLELNDEESIAGFAAANGVNKEKFIQAFRSFSVRMKVEKARQMNRDFAVSSVPAFVIGGRYYTTPVMAGGGAAVMQVVDFLIKKAAGRTGTK